MLINKRNWNTDLQFGWQQRQLFPCLDNLLAYTSDLLVCFTYDHGECSLMIVVVIRHLHIKKSGLTRVIIAIAMTIHCSRFVGYSVDISWIFNSDLYG